MKRLLLLLSTLFLLIGCNKADNDVIDKPSILEVGQKVELVSTQGNNLTFKRVDGGIVLDGDEDKIIIFDIFGTFCEPCKREAPALMKMQLDYNDKIVFVGLSYFEDVDDEYIIEKFQKPYNAYYFIASNSPKNKALVDTILHDIKYERMISLPFKVVLNQGKYEIVTDKWEGKLDTKFYIGDVGTGLIKEDLEKIMSKNEN